MTLEINSNSSLTANPARVKTKRTQEKLALSSARRSKTEPLVVDDSSVSARAAKSSNSSLPGYQPEYTDGYNLETAEASAKSVVTKVQDPSSQSLSINGLSYDPLRINAIILILNFIQSELLPEQYASMGQMNKLILEFLASQVLQTGNESKMVLAMAKDVAEKNLEACISGLVGAGTAFVFSAGGAYTEFKAQKMLVEGPNEVELNELYSRIGAGQQDLKAYMEAKQNIPLAKPSTPELNAKRADLLLGKEEAKTLKENIQNHKQKLEEATKSLNTIYSQDELSKLNGDNITEHVKKTLASHQDNEKNAGLIADGEKFYDTSKIKKITEREAEFKKYNESSFTVKEIKDILSTANGSSNDLSIIEFVEKEVNTWNDNENIPLSKIVDDKLLLLSADTGTDQVKFLIVEKNVGQDQTVSFSIEKLELGTNKKLAEFIRARESSPVHHFINFKEAKFAIDFNQWSKDNHASNPTILAGLDDQKVTDLKRFTEEFMGAETQYTGLKQYLDNASKYLHPGDYTSRPGIYSEKVQNYKRLHDSKAYKMRAFAQTMAPLGQMLRAGADMYTTNQQNDAHIKQESMTSLRDTMRAQTDQIMQLIHSTSQNISSLSSTVARMVQDQLAAISQAIYTH